MSRQTGRLVRSRGRVGFGRGRRRGRDREDAAGGAVDVIEARQQLVRVRQQLGSGALLDVVDSAVAGFQVVGEARQRSIVPRLDRAAVRSRARIGLGEIGEEVELLRKRRVGGGIGPALGRPRRLQQRQKETDGLGVLLELDDGGRRAGVGVREMETVEVGEVHGQRMGESSCRAELGEQGAVVGGREAVGGYHGVVAGRAGCGRGVGMGG